MKTSKWSRLALATALCAASALYVTQPAEAATGKHCVVEVIGETADKTFILSSPKCYGTFAEVLRAEGATSVSSDIAPSESQSFLAVASIIGVHYDGTNGSGASFSVTGSDCNGGGFNVAWDWNDRISSTLNGCGSIVHYQNTGYTGLTQTTFGSGSTTNLNANLNNATSSIRYFS